MKIRWLGVELPAARRHDFEKASESFLYEMSPDGVRMERQIDSD
jgi:hypothetical protein